MALMKIAEPGQSPLPHQAKRAIGIDLGTTNSLVATVRGGRNEVLPDAAGSPMLPSVVHYAADREPLARGSDNASSTSSLHSSRPSSTA